MRMWSIVKETGFPEVLRRYAVYTIQHRRHHDSWVKKKMYPQEDDFHHTVFSNLERLDKLQPTLEASEESLVHKDRGDGERPVNARVVQVAPLRCESSKLESLAKKTIWMPRKANAEAAWSCKLQRGQLQFRWTSTWVEDMRELSLNHGRVQGHL
uniref:Uncharacterized protein n=1 Tax=Pongo abelii TaxID=9601 RepID=H2P523_PONAB